MHLNELAQMFAHLVFDDVTFDWHVFGPVKTELISAMRNFEYMLFH